MLKYPFSLVIGLFMLVGIIGFIWDTKNPAQTLQLIGLCGSILTTAIKLASMNQGD
jgi:hypothetical protein